MAEPEDKTTDDKRVEKPAVDESRPREDKSWPPSGLQNKTHPKPSGEK